MKATVLLLLIQMIGEVQAETGPITDHITSMSTVPEQHEKDAHFATDGNLDTKVFVSSDVSVVDGNTEYFSELKATLDGVFCIEKIKINFRDDMVYEFSCEENGDCTGTNPDAGTSWITYFTTVALEGDVDSSLYKACEIGAMGNAFGVHIDDMASLNVHEWVPVGVEAELLSDKEEDGKDEEGKEGGENQEYSGSANKAASGVLMLGILALLDMQF